MKNPCDQCVVRPMCNKSQTCHELYKYENYLVEQWYINLLGSKAEEATKALQEIKNKF